MVNALGGSIPAKERVIVCEEVFELRLACRDTVAMQCRQPSLEGTGEIPLRRLVKEALREPKPVGWHMAGGHVADGVVYLGMVYVGIGGAPSDIRKIVGKKVRGMPYTDAECVVGHRNTDVLE